MYRGQGKKITGLANFVSDIRRCKSPQEEQARIDEELAKIRKVFNKTSVDSYSKKKYMWKIMYMYMLGYDVDFGHMQAVDLINSNVYSEKNVGYVGVALLLTEHTELLRLCINSVRNDLQSRNEVFQCLALAAVANVGGREFSEALTTDVLNLVVSETSRNNVRKKASLCLLRLIRQYPDTIPPPERASEIIKLIDHRNIGVVQAVVSLLLGLATYDSKSYAPAVHKVVEKLKRYVLLRECSKEYLYYRTPCPWLQVKLIRFLQYYPPISKKGGGREVKADLLEVLEKILNKTEVTQSVNKNNADHAILFEAVNLIIHYNISGEKILHEKTTQYLAKFIGVKEPNIRYLGLDTMARFAKIPDTHDLIKTYLKTIQYSLDDADISIRRRALDLLYSIADEENIQEIVDHLLRYLANCDYSIRQELVLKIAILTEKFASDLRWYVSVAFQLVSIADNFVSEDVWHRIVQIVTNNEQLQQYAAQEVYNLILEPPVHETMVKVAGYILGEFGHLIEVEGKDQFHQLHKHFNMVTPTTKAMLLSTYMKLANLYEEVGPIVTPVFKQHVTCVDEEIQQRAVEYQEMVDWDNQELISNVWEAMPDFPERENLLTKKTKEREAKTADKHIFAKELVDDREVWGGEDEVKDDDSSSGSSDSSDASDDDDDEGDKQRKSKPRKASAEDSPADFLDMDAMLGSTPSQPPPPAYEAPTSNAGAFDKRSALVKLAITSSGVLFEDGKLQIGVKMMADAANGILKVKLFYGNLQQTPLTGLRFKPPSDGGGLQFEVSPNEAFDVSPSVQIQQFVRVSCLKPFEAPPEFTVTYSDGMQPIVLRLKFPALFTKFVTPYNVEPSEFGQRWKQMACEEQAVIELTQKFTTEKLVAIIGTAMGYAVISGVDPNPNNVVGCGVFHTSKNVTMPTLLRFEHSAEAQKARVSVKSPHDSVSKSAIATFSFVFGKAG